MYIKTFKLIKNDAFSFHKHFSENWSEQYRSSLLTEKTILGDQIWQTTNALKSIALQRLHRIEEALELVDSVAQAEPSDETVLQMLSNIYRDCNKPEFIPKIYENALKKNESEDLYT